MGPHVTEQLSALMDGELPADERAQVESHLRACAACAAHLAELRAVEAAARALPLEVPDGYFDSFPGRVRERLSARRRPRPLLVPVWIGAAAAAVVLALLTPRLLREPAVPPPAVVADRVISPPHAPAAPPAAKAELRKPDSAKEAARPEPPPAPRPPRTPAPSDAGVLFSRQDPERPQANAREGYAALPDEVDRDQKATAESVPADRMPAGSAPRAKRIEGQAENGVPTQAAEAKTRRDGPALGGMQDRAAAPSASETRYRALLGKTPSSAAEARALRDAWRAYLRAEPAGPRADEARVRAIEAGIAAWRAGGDAKDRAEAEREGREYLARTDARQPDRVRAALQTLSR